MVNDYKLKKKDFIPLVGWFKYHNKIRDTSIVNHLKYFPNELVLVAYNVGVIFTPFIAAAGLESLLK